jgi:carboxypeptidase C (cathepsin A)
MWQMEVYPGGHMFYNRPGSMLAFLKDAMELYAR